MAKISEEKILNILKLLWHDQGMGWWATILQVLTRMSGGS